MLLYRGKILNPSQVDTLYYQVHKVRPITECHVLQLGSTITIQEPIEVYQVSLNKNIKSMQNVNHTSAHISIDVSSPLCVSNDTCHTSTRVSNDTQCVYAMT